MDQRVTPPPHDEDGPAGGPARDHRRRDHTHDTPPASELLQNLLDAFPEESVTVGDIIRRLEGQAFGLLLLLLALPNCIPNIPGLSTIFGVLMLAPAVQLIFGAKDVWLPGRIMRWSISRDALRMAIKGALPVLRRIERYVAPRWTFLVDAPFRQFLGVQVLVLALVLILPIPFGNWPPGMTVAAIALALLQRDGRLAVLSVPMAVVSIGIAWAGAWAGLKVLQEFGELIQRAFGAMF
jgi:hypothetical protein